MAEHTLDIASRQIILDLLKKVTEANRAVFKRMYSKQPRKKSLTEIVNEMDPESYRTAISQIERTIEHNANYKLDFEKGEGK